MIAIPLIARKPDNLLFPILPPGILLCCLRIGALAWKSLLPAFDVTGNREQKKAARDPPRRLCS
jgi:hypothetical protein